jgi:hypothetical protein
MVVLGALLIAGGDTPKLFEPIDQALHSVAQPVDGPIKGSHSVLTTLTWDREANAMLAQVLANRPTAVALIANNAAGAALGPAGPRALDRPLLHQQHEHRSLMALPRRQQPGEWLAVALGSQMNFGAEAALTAA